MIIVESLYDSNVQENGDTEERCDAPMNNERNGYAKDASNLMQSGSRLVIIMPALNEEATIKDVIARIPKSVKGFDVVIPLVVDDGSVDRTVALAREAGAEVVSHRINRGVGAAFATGIDAALRMGASVVVNMDSDGQFAPEDIPQLLKPIVEDGYGFVTCSRFAVREYVPVMPWVKRWGNRMMCHLVNWVIWNSEFTDVSCGFRAYTRDTALRLNLFGSFTYTQESFIDLAAKGVRMTEVPLRVRGVREFGKSRVASNLLKYIQETTPIILRAMRDTRPLKFFGIIAALLVFVGVCQFSFVAAWWLRTGHTSPWTSLINISVGALLLGIIIAVMALVADQIGRLKKIQEEILLFHRMEYYATTPLARTQFGHVHTPSGPNGDHQPDNELSIRV